MTNIFTQCSKAHKIDAMILKMHYVVISLQQRTGINALHNNNTTLVQYYLCIDTLIILHQYNQLFTTNIVASMQSTYQNNQ